MKKILLSLLPFVMLSCGNQQRNTNQPDDSSSETVLTAETDDALDNMPLPCDTLLNDQCYGNFEVISQFFEDTRDIKAIDLPKLVRKARIIGEKVGYSDKMRTMWEEDIEKGYADGITSNMIEANYQSSALYHFRSLLIYDEIFGTEQGHRAVDLLIDEAKTWESLHEAFQQFMGNVAYMENFGGTIAHITSTGYATEIRHQRMLDLQLMLQNIKGDNKAIDVQSDMNTSRQSLIESCTSLVAHFKNNANEYVGDYLSESERNEYMNLVEECHELEARIRYCSTKWIQSRRQLSDNIGADLSNPTSQLFANLSKMGSAV